MSASMDQRLAAARTIRGALIQSGQCEEGDLIEFPSDFFANTEPNTAEIAERIRSRVGSGALPARLR